MNWMTATGFALIAGGIATLICFRKLLWSGHFKERDATARRTVRIRVVGTAPRPVLPAQGSAPEISGAHRMSGAAVDGAYGDQDPAGESEPTAVVPTWPPARPFDRVEPPRTSPEEPRARAGRHQAGDVAGQHWKQLDRDGRDGWRRGHGSDEGEDPALRRPQPRPDPAGYVSRHAAD
jgi:hypothetical protein